MATQTQIYVVVTQQTMFQMRVCYHFLKMLTTHCVGGGGVCIKLFGMFSKTDGGSLGLDFPFIFKTGKPGGICLTQTTVFGYLVCCPLEWLLSIFVVLLDLMLFGTRLHFSVLRDNWIYSQLQNTF